MDVEGQETILLDPSVIPNLKYTSIIVEAHDLYIPNCSQVIESRFSDSHNIQKIMGTKRNIDDWPKKLNWLKFLFPDSLLIEFMEEGRPCLMHWYYLTPKNQ
jgi:hypothetical protein